MYPIQKLLEEEIEVSLRQLEDLRASITETKKELHIHDEVRRKDFQDSIRLTGNLIQEFRSVGEESRVSELIKMIQFLNRERHTNRLHVKFLAEKQSYLKKSFKEISTHLSHLQNEYRKHNDTLASI